MTTAEQPVKLAIVSGLLRLYPLDLALRLIREAGYDGVEIWGGQYHGHIWDLVEEHGGEFVLNRERVRAIRAMCDDLGLEIAAYTPEQLLYPTNYLVDQAPPFDGPALRDHSRKGAELCIEAASELGCSRMALVTPFWLWTADGSGYRRTTRQEVLDASLEEIARFVGVAERAGVTILFEPLVYHDTNGIATLEEAATVFDQIESPHLELMLDYGHVAVTANREGHEPVAYLQAHFDRFGSRIGHIHIDDNHGQIDAHLAPGEGTIDLQGMTNVVLGSGYSGWISAELAFLGPYALPENAEPLLRSSREIMANLIASATPS
jgi:fructoselysine 3-epimerase